MTENKLIQNQYYKQRIYHFKNKYFKVENKMLNHFCMAQIIQRNFMSITINYTNHTVFSFDVLVYISLKISLFDFSLLLFSKALLLKNKKISNILVSFGAWKLKKKPFHPLLSNFPRRGTNTFLSNAKMHFFAYVVTDLNFLNDL